MKTSRTRARTAALLAALLPALAACGESFPPGPPDELDRGVLATFQVVEDTFRVWATHPEAVRQLIALRDGRSRANIPIGRLRQGPGKGQFNAPWSWHHPPDSVGMAEVAIEVCDGRPSFVEENVADWIGELYCPWSAELLALQDLR